MGVVFDSLALIAACVEMHPKHDSALSWLKRAKKKEIEYLVAAHFLLEVYSVLTSAPFKPRISSFTVKRLIEQNIQNDAKIISLTKKDYNFIMRQFDR